MSTSTGGSEMGVPSAACACSVYWTLRIGTQQPQGKGRNLGLGLNRLDPAHQERRESEATRPLRQGFGGGVERADKLLILDHDEFARDAGEPIAQMLLIVGEFIGQHSDRPSLHDRTDVQRRSRVRRHQGNADHALRPGDGGISRPSLQMVRLARWYHEDGAVLGTVIICVTCVTPHSPGTQGATPSWDLHPKQVLESPAGVLRHRRPIGQRRKRAQDATCEPDVGDSIPTVDVRQDVDRIDRASPGGSLGTRSGWGTM